MSCTGLPGGRKGLFPSGGTPSPGPGCCGVERVSGRRLIPSPSARSPRVARSGAAAPRAQPHRVLAPPPLPATQPTRGLDPDPDRARSPQPHYAHDPRISRTSEHRRACSPFVFRTPQPRCAHSPRVTMTHTQPLAPLDACPGPHPHRTSMDPQLQRTLTARPGTPVLSAKSPRVSIPAPPRCPRRPPCPAPPRTPHARLLPVPPALRADSPRRRRLRRSIRPRSPEPGRGQPRGTGRPGAGLLRGDRRRA